MARDPKHDILFEPIEIGPKTMKNRFYQIPHCNGFGSEKPLNQAHFRAMKAEGGYAAVCTEYCSIHPESDDTHRVSARLWDDDDIRTSGSCATCSTSTARSPPPSSGTAARMRPAWRRAASRARPRRSRADFEHLTYPKEMDKDDIREVQSFYVEAAKRAREAGFDIVYVYGSHSYLPQQFLTPYYNQRTDEYGGSFENRARFWRETIEQVQEAVGDDCAIAVRMSTDMFMGEAGTQLERDVLPFVELVDELVDVWDINVSGISEWGEDATPSRFYAVRPHAPVAEGRQGRLEEAGARRRALHEPGHDGRGDQRRRSSTSSPPAGRRSPIRSFRRRSTRAGSTTSASASAATSASRAGRSAARRSSARRTRPPARSTGAAGIRSVRAGRRTPTTTSSSSAQARPGWSARVSSASAACAASTSSRRQDDMGGIMRWIPQFPGLGEWGRVVNYRKIQIDKLKNVEFIPNTRLDAKGVKEYGAEIVIVATGGYWATDGLNGCTHDTIPGADASQAVGPDARADHGRGQGAAGRAAC